MLKVLNLVNAVWLEIERDASRTFCVLHKSRPSLLELILLLLH